jgi:hypothetical protein
VSAGENAAFSNPRRAATIQRELSYQVAVEQAARLARSLSRNAYWPVLYAVIVIALANDGDRLLPKILR